LKPDPNTKEGQVEIEKILKCREAEAKEARERSEKTVDDEPSGKLTSPNEIDLHRDRVDDKNE